MSKVKTAAAKKITAGGLEYNPYHGRQWGSASRPTSYNGMLIPGEDIASMTQKEVKKLIDLMLIKQSPLTKAEVLGVLGAKAGTAEKWAFYQELLDINYENGALEYNSAIYKDSQDGSPNMAKMKEWEADPDNQAIVGERERVLSDSSSGDSVPEYDPKANYYDLMIDTENRQAAQYRSDMYASIDRQQAEIDQSLAAYEIDAYKMIGQQQMQLENQIAEARKQALRSGTTSAQLAAQQLQNMFAAQSGAAQVAQGVMGQRMNYAQQFAQQRGSVEPSLYDIANQNRGLLTQAGSQNYAAYMGYASYAPHLQAQGLASLKPSVRSYYDDIIKQKGS